LNPVSPEENIFILISRIIPRNDQVPLTSAILSTIDELCNILPTGGVALGCMDLWDIWTTVHTSSNLGSLKDVLKLRYELQFYLDDRLEPNVVKLIQDASVVFVGERTLFKLKAAIKRRHASGLVYDWYLQDYKAILDTLFRRKIKVNQDLFAFLGRLLVWEGNDGDGDGDGDGDEDERAFFETSDEESDESENDSVESDI
jgi:hypothetical protein